MVRKRGWQPDRVEVHAALLARPAPERSVRIRGAQPERERLRLPQPGEERLETLEAPPGKLPALRPGPSRSPALAGHACPVAGRLEQLLVGLEPIGEDAPEVRRAFEPPVPLSGENRAARRRAGGRRDVGVVRQGALACDAVEVRCLDDRIAVGGSVRPAPVVGDREQDVRGVVLSRGGSPGCGGRHEPDAEDGAGDRNGPWSSSWHGRFMVAGSKCGCRSIAVLWLPTEEKRRAR